MKKFIYLMALVCTLGMFTACSSSDDPEPTVWDNYQGGDYAVWFENLDTEGDDLYNEIMDLKMNVAKADNNKAKVSITGDGILISVPEATIEESNGNIKLAGAGTVLVEDEGDSHGVKTRMELDPNACRIEATISSDKKVSLTLTAQGQSITATSDEKPALAKLISYWDLEPMVMYDGNGNVVSDPDKASMWGGSFKMTWETKEDCPPVLGFLPAASAAQMANSIVNQLMPNLLKSVVFTKDGQIIAQYAEAKSSDEETKDNTTPTWLIAKDYATYKVVNDNQILVFLNNDQISNTVTDPVQKAALSTILSVFKDGIPVNIRWSNNDNTAYFYLDQTFATALASNPVLAGLVANLGDDDLGGFAPMIKAIMQQMPSLMESTTKFEAGLELTK